jgi:hypothetical protein
MAGFETSTEAIRRTLGWEEVKAAEDGTIVAA